MGAVGLRGKEAIVTRQTRNPLASSLPAEWRGAGRSGAQPRQRQFGVCQRGTAEKQRQHANTTTVGTGHRTLETTRSKKSPSMFVFGSAAKADADGDDGGGRGEASTATDGAPSFAFDASFLPAVTATPTANGDDAPAAAGGFKFNEAGAGVKTGTKRDEATDGGSGEAPSAIHSSVSSVASAAGETPGFITEVVLMNSGHELHEIYTCPLCCLPVALPVAKHSSRKPCCMKMVCDGCTYASYQRGMGDTCAFCRAPTPFSDAAMLALVQKRVNAKDPVAIKSLADANYRGNYGLPLDIPRAIELWTEAARLGDLGAHFNLGCRYYNGEGVKTDVARGIRHLQHAAIHGHPNSRHT
ncbi:hypothetical protein THAOC_12937, partial [Thalassiosira oceanica]